MVEYRGVRVPCLLRGGVPHHLRLVGLRLGPAQAGHLPENWLGARSKVGTKNTIISYLNESHEFKYD